MNRMNRWYFCKQYVVQALRNAHTQLRWHCFPRLFYLMPVPRVVILYPTQGGSREYAG